MVQKKNDNTFIKLRESIKNKIKQIHISDDEILYHLKPFKTIKGTEVKKQTGIFVLNVDFLNTGWKNYLEFRYSDDKLSEEWILTILKQINGKWINPEKMILVCNDTETRYNFGVFLSDILNIPVYMITINEVSYFYKSFDRNMYKYKESKIYNIYKKYFKKYEV